MVEVKRMTPELEKKLAKVTEAMNKLSLTDRMILYRRKYNRHYEALHNSKNRGVYLRQCEAYLLSQTYARTIRKMFKANVWYVDLLDELDTTYHTVMSMYHADKAECTNNIEKIHNMWQEWIGEAKNELEEIREKFKGKDNDFLALAALEFEAGNQYSYILSLRKAWGVEMRRIEAASF